jgi:hypothetical protein
MVEFVARARAPEKGRTSVEGEGDSNNPDMASSERRGSDRDGYRQSPTRKGRRREGS